MARIYGQRETDDYNGNGYTGNGKLVHAIVNGKPVCGAGYSSLGISHKRHPRITPTAEPVNCTRCAALAAKETR